jgi:Glycosyltransferase
MAEILIDFTDTYITGLNTGIQRVVRNIIKNKNIIKDITNKEVIPTIFVGKPVQKDAIYKKRNIVHKIRQHLVRYPYLYSIAARSYKRFSKYKPDIIKSKLSDESITVADDDILFVGDAFWSECYEDEFFEFASKLNLVLLIHDIIPITHPDIHSEHIVKAFNTKVIDMIKISKLILTVSKSEAKIIENFLRSKNIDKPIYPIRLGTDIKISQSIKKPNGFDVKDFYLMVGTVEPRKNHLFVLEAFHKIWKENQDFPNLVIAAGRFGWKYQSVLDFIMSSPFKDKKLFFIESPPDEELEYLYQNAKALIMASIREGFGLPIVEAMAKHKPILASDIEVFKEVAGDYPIYFDPYNVDSLIDAIKSFETGAIKPSLLNITLNTWEDTAKDIAIAIKKHFNF